MQVVLVETRVQKAVQPWLSHEVATFSGLLLCGQGKEYFYCRHTNSLSSIQIAIAATPTPDRSDSGRCVNDAPI